MKNGEICTIVQDVLKVKKELIAIKVWKKEPDGIRRYEGKAFPGMCGQIGEVLTSKETFLTDLSNQLCTGGMVATGVASPPSGDQIKEILAMHIEMTKDYGDLETATRYHEESVEMIPPVRERNEVVQLGLFREIFDPDLVLIFCTPGAADILNRAYSYVTGESIRGFGGNGGCLFAVQYPYVMQKPSFSYSDISWRKFVGLEDEELTMTFPLESLLRFIAKLPAVAEEYRNFGTGMG